MVHYSVKLPLTPKLDRQLTTGQPGQGSWSPPGPPFRSLIDLALRDGRIGGLAACRQADRSAARARLLFHFAVGGTLYLSWLPGCLVVWLSGCTKHHLFQRNYCPPARLPACRVRLPWHPFKDRDLGWASSKPPRVLPCETRPDQTRPSQATFFFSPVFCMCFDSVHFLFPPFGTNCLSI